MDNFDLNFWSTLQIVAQISFDMKLYSMKSCTFLIFQAYICLYVEIHYFSGVFK